MLAFQINWLRFAIPAALVFLAFHARSTVLDQWHWRNPQPQGNTLHSISYINGAYLALGEFGTILTSTDGTNWVRQTSGTSVDLRACAYGAGKYVVVGDFGTVLVSTNTTLWMPYYPGSFYSLYGVAYGNGRFVGVGEQGIILSSVDGATWTQQSSGSWILFGIVYDNAVFVAVGGRRGSSSSPALRVILTSPDGNVWTHPFLESGAPFSSLAYGDGQFSAVTLSEPYADRVELWASVNGIEWQPNAFPFLPRSSCEIFYGNGKWIVAARIFAAL